tara:strand:- start:2642 stop:3526 length:885 start_codon:yes stop_codon:yes gene_type:complete
MTVKLGIIGGSGLYDFAEMQEKEWLPRNEGPFGLPSDEILFGKINETEVFFLPRHGRNHVYSPTTVPYKANIDALKRLGCNVLISISAVGSLREDLTPGMFVIVDQFIDRTFAREKTFFDKEVVAHVSMAQPICTSTAKMVMKAAKSLSIQTVFGGTYLAMEGPQFSSYAESQLYRSWGCDVIGMTNMPEAKLAREAEMRYTSVAMVTDFDCWHENEGNVEVTDIIKVLHENASNAKLLIKAFVENYKKDCSQEIIDGIDNVLDTAIITQNFSEETLINCGLDAIASRIINAGK